MAKLSASRCMKSDSILEAIVDPSGIEKTLNRQQLGSDLVKVSGSSISTVWVGSDPFKK